VSGEAVAVPAWRALARLTLAPTRVPLLLLTGRSTLSKFTNSKGWRRRTRARWQMISYYFEVGRSSPQLRVRDCFSHVINDYWCPFLWWFQRNAKVTKQNSSTLAIKQELIFSLFDTTVLSLPLCFPVRKWVATMIITWYRLGSRRKLRSLKEAITGLKRDPSTVKIYVSRPLRVNSSRSAIYRTLCHDSTLPFQQVGDLTCFR
jgi:hypothetical protein